MLCDLVTNAQPYTVLIVYYLYYIILVKENNIFGGVKRGRK